MIDKERINKLTYEEMTEGNTISHIFETVANSMMNVIKKYYDLEDVNETVLYLDENLTQEEVDELLATIKHEMALTILTELK